MGKNLKKIVAIAVAIGSVSAIAPATHGNLLTTKAYASSSDINLKVKDKDGTIRLYDDDDYKDKVNSDDVDDGDTYYTKAKDEVTFDVSGADGGDSYVKIFKDDADDDNKGYSNGHKFSIADDQDFVIRVYDEDEDKDDVKDAKYGDDDLDYKDYKVDVECDDEDSDEEDNDEDEFDSLELLNADGDAIKLYSDDDYDSDNKVDSGDVEKGETYYAKTSSNKVKFDVDGDVDDDYVKVFKSTSDSAKGYDIDEEFDVTSDKTFTVRIYDGEPDDDVTYEDDDNVIGEYTIELHYTGDGTSTGTSGNTADSTPTSAAVVSTAKPNQWIQVNGQWQYNDSTGAPVKNAWVQNYFLKADGNMATGWTTYNGSWYYLGYDGAKKTGWQSVGGTWYYLDTEGRMQTGWVKDISGKYYYLNSNGSMAYSTTIDGYRLGADGAWIH